MLYKNEQDQFEEKTRKDESTYKISSPEKKISIENLSETEDC